MSLESSFSFSIAPSDWKGLNTHYQINGNYQQEDYKSWVDNWTVTCW